MLRTIIEGEPGIFPDPVARVMRKIGGLFDRSRSTRPEPPDERGTDRPVDEEPRTGEPRADGRRTDEPRADDASEPGDGRHDPGAV